MATSNGPPTPAPAALDPDSVWTRIQAQSVTLPPEVIDKLAELDLELSEGTAIRGKNI